MVVGAIAFGSLAGLCGSDAPTQPSPPESADYFDALAAAHRAQEQRAITIVNLGRDPSEDKQGFADYLDCYVEHMRLYRQELAALDSRSGRNASLHNELERWVDDLIAADEAIRTHIRAGLPADDQSADNAQRAVDAQQAIMRTCRLLQEEADSAKIAVDLRCSDFLRAHLY